MMLEKKTVEFIDELSSGSPVPGGGGACAAVGALAAALGMMVANLTVGKKRYADVEDEMQECLSRLKELRDRLIVLTDQDAEAFEPLSRAYGLPRETEEDRIRRERVMESALYEASIVPLRIMETIRETMQYLETLGAKGSRIAVSDAGVGILFAQAALEGASMNVFINTKLMKDRARAEELNQKADNMIEEGRRQKERVCKEVFAGIRRDAAE